MAERPILYYITDRSQFPGDEAARRRALLDKIAEAAHAGVDYIQLREKDLSTRELERLAEEAVRVVREQGRSTSGGRRATRLLINSRTDVALAVGADGVHLRSEDVSASEVRLVLERADSRGQIRGAGLRHDFAESTSGPQGLKPPLIETLTGAAEAAPYPKPLADQKAAPYPKPLADQDAAPYPEPLADPKAAPFPNLGPFSKPVCATTHILIGVSCHAVADVLRAKSEGADFVVFAPVFEKKNAVDTVPQGLGALREACRVRIPVLALGGVTLENASACLEAGAAGIAGIRLFQENRISEVVRTLKGS